MAETIGRELDWDDEIENEGGGWVLLPEGEYDFIVEKFERGRHEGSAKIPPCNKAVLTLGMDCADGRHALGAGAGGARALQGEDPRLHQTGRHAGAKQ